MSSLSSPSPNNSFVVNHLKLKVFNWNSSVCYSLSFSVQVKWLQQQHEKIRRKRDGPYREIPTYSPYNILRQPNDYAIDPNTNPHFSSYSSDPLISTSPLMGLGGAGGTHSPRLEYRDVTSHLVFTDPLFKEQWYLVSKVCNLTALLSFILSIHLPRPTLVSLCIMFRPTIHTHSYIHTCLRYSFDTLSSYSKN